MNTLTNLVSSTCINHKIWMHLNETEIQCVTNGWSAYKNKIYAYLIWKCNGFVYTALKQYLK